MKRVAIYARVSTDEQKKGLSIPTQVEALQNYAKANNYKVVDIYADEGFSGAKLKRPQLQRLLKDIEEHKVDIVLFTYLDRWFRSVAHYHKIQTVLEENNVSWICIKEDYETVTASGQFKVNIMLSVSQQYRDTQSEKILFSNEERVRKGFYLSGETPKGYKLEKVEGGSIVVKDEEYAPFVEDYFNQLEITHSIRASQLYVNAKYGTSFTRQVFTSITRNDLFVGEYRGIKNFCEPYLTRERRDRILDIIKNKNVKRNTANRSYIFTGLIKCAECGTKFAGWTTVNVRPYGRYKYKSYRCRNSSRNNTCHNKITIHENTIEKRILSMVKSELENYIVSVELKEKTQKKVKSKAVREEVQKEIDRLNLMFQKGRINETDYDNEYELLSMKLAELEKEEKPINVEPLKKIVDSNILELYKDFTDEEKRIFWRSFIDYIVIDKDKNLRIYFLS